MNEKSGVLVSFCLPVFNVCQYINDCIISIEHEKLEEKGISYEILCVDDCSSDDSYDIIKALQKQYKNIKLLRNEKNMGVSFTRNFMIKEALGKYIWFVDPDDMLYPNFSDLIKKARELDADSLIGCYTTCADEDSFLKFNINYKNNNSLKINSLYENMCNDKNIKLPVWCGGIYKKQFLFDNNILFNEGLTFAEDVVFYSKVTVLSNSNYRTDATSYIYRMRKGSAMQTHTFEVQKKHYECMLEMLFEYQKLFNDNRVIHKSILADKIHHSKEGVTIQLACVPNKQYIKSELKKLKQLDIYPYPKRKGALYAKRGNHLTKFLTYNLNNKICFWLFHYLYCFKHRKQFMVDKVK